MVNFVFQLGLDQIGESVATAEDAPAAAPHPPIARPQAGQVKSTGYLRSGQVRSGQVRLPQARLLLSDFGNCTEHLQSLKKIEI